MFKPKIALPKEVLEKVRLASQVMGASSVEEFAAKMLETECDKILAQTASQDLSAVDVEDIANKLKGLGYLE